MQDSEKTPEILRSFKIRRYLSFGEYFYQGPIRLILHVILVFLLSYLALLSSFLILSFIDHLSVYFIYLLSLNVPLLASVLFTVFYWGSCQKFATKYEYEHELIGAYRDKFSDETIEKSYWPRFLQFTLFIEALRHQFKFYFGDLDDSMLSQSINNITVSDVLDLIKFSVMDDLFNNRKKDLIETCFTKYEEWYELPEPKNLSGYIVSVVGSLEYSKKDIILKDQNLKSDSLIGDALSPLLIGIILLLIQHFIP